MTLDGYPSTGVPTCADSKLLTGLARETFGFGELSRAVHRPLSLSFSLSFSFFCFAIMLFYV